MARLEDLIGDVADPQLRDRIAGEVAKLKAKKRFGLVFEAHLPEVVQLPGLPVKPGVRVAKRAEKNTGFYLVTASINGKKVKIAPERGGPEEVAAKGDLVVVKRFGEPMYPALVPMDRVTRAPGKPYHTLINADNFHALQVLLYCYEGQVDVIYIDPPYNTGARDWKYNNDYVDKADQYRHSKWLSMMKKRLELAARLLKSDGVLIVTIDDNEVNTLGMLLDSILPERTKHLITVVINPGGTYKMNFARVHEYAYFICPADKETITGTPVVQEELEVGEAEEEDGWEYWKLRRTGAESAHRHQRPKQFYPIYVDEMAMKVVRVGENIGRADEFSTKKVGGLTPVYPIDGAGVQRVWRYSRKTMAEKVAEDAVIAKRASDGAIGLHLRVPKKDTKRLKTVWWEGNHSSAGTAGTVLVDAILGRPGSFPFPKSLYVVKDAVAAVCRNRPKALVVDFFAGSGTTLHATAMLNREDGGSRQCILVANDEVDEKTAKRLTSEGIEEGTREYAANGICSSVTWPRCKFAIAGRRDDGSKIEGQYADGSTLAEGLRENAQYLKLDFLDPAEVKRGETYEAILPILWMMAGASGNLDLAKGGGKHHFPKGCSFCVLLHEAHFADFATKLAERADITHVFLVTDSVEAFHEMAGQVGKGRRCVQLYKSYLDNFKINLEPKYAD
ncbi:MAG: site-specific DNA-methyltransferase [Planctomycetota bacterium]|nr:site-specific DNA-methyltransferase [Planctomycetota bacterium]